MEMVIVLPLAIAIGLAVTQFITIAIAKFRVEVAAAEAAERAAAGKNIDEVHRVAGLVLSPHLQGAYQTELEYYDKAEDPNAEGQKGEAGKAEPDFDHVIVSVRIPMECASRNWLGFIGGSVKNLHIRSVIKLPVSETFDLPTD